MSTILLNINRLTQWRTAMRLFDGNDRIWPTQGAFYIALKLALDGLEKTKRVDFSDLDRMREFVKEWSIPIGGHVEIDPIHHALYAGVHYKNDVVGIVAYFQVAWEHYQKICRAEGYIIA